MVAQPKTRGGSCSRELFREKSRVFIGTWLQLSLLKESVEKSLTHVAKGDGKSPAKKHGMGVIID
jgi:hypothetical protein